MARPRKQKPDSGPEALPESPTQEVGTDVEPEIDPGEFTELPGSPGVVRCELCPELDTMGSHATCTKRPVNNDDNVIPDVGTIPEWCPLGYRPVDQEKPKIYKDERRVKVLFTHDELFEKGQRMAFLSAELSDLEEEKKAVAADFKAKIDTRKATISLLGTQINSGFEYRSVDCTTTLNDPTPGMKTTRRDDTGEVVDSEPMSASEMQIEINFD